MMTPAQPPRGQSLSTKLLFCTVFFVLVAEVVVLIPSIAQYRTDWFAERIEGAYLVGLALDGSQQEMIDEDVAMKLFDTAGILGVTVEKEGVKVLILAPDINPHGPSILHRVDMENESFAERYINPWGALFSTGDSFIRVIGMPRHMPLGKADIIVSQRDLRTDLRIYARNIALLSLVISTLTAALVYWALNRIIVKPVQSLTANITVFEHDPERVEHILTPSGRLDEIGIAETSLADMEKRIHALLGERRRLAALGAGISKISHDLRNILASAQLMSDRLARSDDPQVKKLSPRLISALDRAITLSRDTLLYGKMEPAALRKGKFQLRTLIEEVKDATAAMGVTFEIDCPDDLSIVADRTQLYRSLFNLAANAVDAMQSAAGEDANTNGIEHDIGEITVTAHLNGRELTIDVADNGTGLSEHALAVLFEPFKGSQKAGGSGLGLAIASEIVNAHGGDLSLLKSDAQGATFRITLPQPAEDAAPQSPSTLPVSQTPSRLGSAPPS